MENANNPLVNLIGSGAGYPIKLVTIYDDDGKPIKLHQPDGSIKNSISWRPESNIDLIKQNLQNLLSTMIGERLRQEEFGTRFYELFEEQNTQVLTFLTRDYLVQAITTFEQRVKVVDIKVTRESHRLDILTNLALIGVQNSEFNFDFTYQT